VVWGLLAAGIKSDYGFVWGPACGLVAFVAVYALGKYLGRGAKLARAERNDEIERQIGLKQREIKRHRGIVSR